MEFSKDCYRCGKCCRWIGVKMMGLSPEVKEWLITRGCTVDGDFLLIPHICQHLKIEPTKPVQTEHPHSRLIYSCDIHYKEGYPTLCRRYHGHGRFYIPEGCVYATPEAEQTEKELFKESIEKSLKRHHNVLKRLAEL